MLPSSLRLAVLLSVLLLLPVCEAMLPKERAVEDYFAARDRSRAQTAGASTGSKPSFASASFKLPPMDQAMPGVSVESRSSEAGSRPEILGKLEGANGVKTLLNSIAKPTTSAITFEHDVKFNSKQLLGPVATATATPPHDQSAELSPDVPPTSAQASKQLWASLARNWDGPSQDSPVELNSGVQPSPTSDSRLSVQKEPQVVVKMVQPVATKSADSAGLVLSSSAAASSQSTTLPITIRPGEQRRGPWLPESPELNGPRAEEARLDLQMDLGDVRGIHPRVAAIEVVKLHTELTPAFANTMIDILKYVGGIYNDARSQCAEAKGKENSVKKTPLFGCPKDDKEQVVFPRLAVNAAVDAWGNFDRYQQPHGYYCVKRSLSDGRFDKTEMAHFNWFRRGPKGGKVLYSLHIGCV